MLEVCLQTKLMNLVIVAVLYYSLSLVLVDTMEVSVRSQRR